MIICHCRNIRESDYEDEEELREAILDDSDSDKRCRQCEKHFEKKG